MKFRSILTGLIIAIWFPLNSQVFDYIVDINGSGDFTSIQAAIDAVPDELDGRFLIFIKSGVYEEKIVMPASKQNVSLIGQSAEDVIISWDDYAGKDGMSSADTYTFLADAPDLYAENITFQNTAGQVGQALAIRTTGDRLVFKNCRFLGFQDTYYAHKNRQYNLRCYVEGGTDFIYGDATSVFVKCTIQCRTDGQYITAPADTKLVSNTPGGKFYHGLLFKNCLVTAESGVPANSYYLGRPWQPDASSVFINSTLGDHIKPEGWSTWSGDNHLSGCYAEYMNITPDGSTVDVSGRVGWSGQLTEEEAGAYYNTDYFLEKGYVKWRPQPVTWSLPEPENVSVDDNTVRWDKVEGSVGYVVYRNDSVAGITGSDSLVLASPVGGSDAFSVKSVNLNGNLSGFSDEPLDSIIAVHPPVHTEKPGMHGQEIFIYGNFLVFPDVVHHRIYNIHGQIVMEGEPAGRAFIGHLVPGIYIVRTLDRNGTVLVQKMMIGTFRY